MLHSRPAATGFIALLALVYTASGAFAQVWSDESADLVAQGCMACHGPGWRGGVNMPALDTLEPAEIVRMMREFQTGERDSTIMQRLALGLTDVQVDRLEKYFANALADSRDSDR